MAKLVPLLIVGAGPFGLAMSAHARRAGVEHVVVGKPMEFWKTHMPQHMVLRSACDWHYDPSDEDTIERYLQTKNLKPNDVEPLALEFYLGYCDWFQQKNAIETVLARVHALNLTHDASTCFEATLEDGKTMIAPKRGRRGRFSLLHERAGTVSSVVSGWPVRSYLRFCRFRSR